MQRSPNVCVVAVWVLFLLVGGTASSGESSDEGTTTVPAACTLKTASTTHSTPVESEPSSLSTAFQSEHSDFEVHSTDQDAPTTDEVTTFSAVEDDHGECLQRPTSDNLTSAELRGSWQVMAGYSREFATSPFCPELAFHVDPEDPNNIIVSWSGVEAFGNIIPHGQMTMDYAGNLADKDGVHEMKVIKLDKFLVLRIRNSDFWRVLYLYPASDTRESVLSDLLGCMMASHSSCMKSDGPAWYICTTANFPANSQGDR